jgi:hypothetical protein
MSARLAKREFATLGGKVYVTHTYSNGVKVFIMQTVKQITAVRIPPNGGAVSSHHFCRPVLADS